MTANDQGLLSVFEFKNIQMKTFEQFIREFYADKFQQYGEDLLTMHTPVSLKGVIELVGMWQKLQQTPVSGRSEQLPPSPYQWLKAKYQIPEGSTYVQPKNITMTQAAGWISEYVQLYCGNCH